MQAYSGSLKGLLRAREQKQVDFEQTTVLLQDQTAQRDRLSSPAAARSTTGFIRSKLEDVRGVDHEQSRRQRVRECEMRIEELTRAAEEAKRDTEAFDEEVVREVQDFERIKRNEFRKQLGGLCDAHGAFYGGVIETWERYVRDMEGEGIIAA
jgi:sorting nexin-4